MSCQYGVAIVLPGRSERLYDAIRFIRPIHQLSAHLVTSQREGQDITMPMRAILERLVVGGAQMVPQVARALRITRQGVQRIVDDAKALGYLETRRNPGHTRSHLIVLTDDGRSACGAIHHDELDPMDHIAAGLSAADFDACARVPAHITAPLRTFAGPDEDS